jgi:catechol 2,3-dioxygenase-like lactoylglutathione lyase family enzyme
MSATRLEHANITVTDTHKTAAMLEALFGWKTRWEGPSIYEGYSVHVGSADSYLALYESAARAGKSNNSYTHVGGLNHLAVVVDDLDAVEARVKAYGLTPESHANYEPGRRFYFTDGDGIEIEVVQYD